MTLPNPMTVTVLGAGAMGSALCTPLRARGHTVRLWGTPLDEDILSALEGGLPHPRTGEHLADGTELVHDPDLESALADADVVVVAVSSDGVRSIVERAAPLMGRAQAVALTTKGFLRDAEGTVRLLPESIERIFSDSAAVPPPIVAVGGPCKANEVAASRPTAAVFGCSDIDVARSIAGAVETDGYRIHVTDDDRGVEVAAPLKNVYAIALGFADGLATRTGQPWHDLRSAVFSKAIDEIAEMTEALGGSARTAWGLSGVGDLEVTGLSGRNKVFGERLGSGEAPAEALQKMIDAHQTVEGVPASGLAVALASQLFDDAASRLPLLHAIRRIVEGCDDPLLVLTTAALPPLQASGSSR